MNRLRRMGSITLLVAALLVAGCGKSVEKQIAEQLELGNKYLTEASYEQAIVAFNKVIELDPKQADAYIGLTQVYVETADFEKAVQILENGKEYLEDSYDERLKEVHKEQVNSFSDDLEQINTFMTELAKQEYSNEAFYLEMADSYREKGMLDVEECCLQAGFRACKTDELMNELERVRDEHRNLLLEKVQTRPGYGGASWSYSDFDNNGTHELFFGGKYLIDNNDYLYDIEFHYVTDEGDTVLFSSQAKGGSHSSFEGDTYGVIWNGESSELVTAYYVFDVVNELPRLVLSREDVNMSLDEVKKEIEQVMDE